MITEKDNVHFLDLLDKDGERNINFYIMDYTGDCSSIKLDVVAETIRLVKKFNVHSPINISSNTAGVTFKEKILGVISSMDYVSSSQLFNMGDELELFHRLCELAKKNGCKITIYFDNNPRDINADHRGFELNKLGKVIKTWIPDPGG